MDCHLHQDPRIQLMRLLGLGPLPHSETQLVHPLGLELLLHPVILLHLASLQIFLLFHLFHLKELVLHLRDHLAEVHHPVL